MKKISVYLHRMQITKSSGFTLIELAIALVVIGIIIGMAVKGISLIDTSNKKADIQRINKIQTAVASYYAKYSSLPASQSALVTEGGVSSNDFTFSDGTTWALQNCTGSSNSGYTEDTYSTSSGMKCVHTDNGIDQTLCILDITLDDGYNTTGYVRGDGATPGNDDYTDAAGNAAVCNGLTGSNRDASVRVW
ncbi:MAG: type II secretion system GspH family protein [Candidatus Magnetoovum sp. WYHC-5]|nr:type II secretion system GspH family protein [Candidatus Magnetoovum sp. WYHC-5]